MTKARRGNYLFLTWVSDHPPRHVHVYKDGKLIVRWNIDSGRPIEGAASRRIRKYIQELVDGGRL